MLSIIGATKERHFIEAAEAAKITLPQEEVARLEQLADATGVDTRGGWEHNMEWKCNARGMPNMFEHFRAAAFY